MCTKVFVLPIIVSQTPHEFSVRPRHPSSCRSPHLGYPPYFKLDGAKENTFAELRFFRRQRGRQGPPFPCPALSHFCPASRHFPEISKESFFRKSHFKKKSFARHFKKTVVGHLPENNSCQSFIQGCEGGGGEKQKKSPKKPTTGTFSDHDFLKL